MLVGASCRRERVADIFFAARIVLLARGPFGSSQISPFIAESSRGHIDVTEHVEAVHDSRDRVEVLEAGQ